ncbi:MAG: DUF2520 domain-containing protein [Eubacterium sp.]|nr:DUF2520 domain-containing protein [Eubacterium sp.]
MQIGMIGAGKVGCSLGKYLAINRELRQAGHLFTGFISKSKESADQAATFTKTRSFDKLEEFVKNNDIICVATPDGVIAEVWNEIRHAGFSLEGKIFCHFSGSLSSDVFSNRRELGAVAASLHPMFAFSNKFTMYQQLNPVIFTMEGDPEARAILREVWGCCGNTLREIPTEKKAKYHAAASTLSNLFIGLFREGLFLLEDCGFSQEEARELVRPLVTGNVEKMLEEEPVQALTGPVERGDIETLSKHLSVLEGRQRQVYENLSLDLVEIAQIKHPERDYSQLEKMLKENR